MSKQFWLLLVVAILLGVPLLGLISAGRSLNPGFTKNVATTSPGAANMMYGGRGESGMAVPSVAQDSTEEWSAVAPEMGMPTGGGVAMSRSAMTYPAPAIDGDFTQGVDRMIVKNASLSLIVADPSASIDSITTIAEKYQGYVTSVNMSDDPIIYEPLPMMYQEKGVMGSLPQREGVVSDSVVSSARSRQAYITLRVPVQSLESVMSEVKGLADRVVSETLSAVDQTEQKLDLDAQLKNLRATEEQLLSLMKQAKNVEETLRVQQELSNVRSQIERMQAQVENLVGSSQMATVTISLSTNEADLPITDDRQPSIWEELKSAVREAGRFYRDLFVAGLKNIILWGPIAIVLGSGYLIWSRRRRSV